MTSANNGRKKLEILISLDNDDSTIVINESSITYFMYKNSINAIPQGEFHVQDPDNKISSLASGKRGSIWFVNTKDVNDNSDARISFITISISKGVALNTTKILWQYGTQVTTQLLPAFSVNGNSVDALLEICKKFEISETKELLTPNKISLPIDKMKWRFVYDNFNECLDKVIQKSYLKNDYLYWYIDDVNTGVNISSFEASNTTSTNVLFVPDPSSANRDIQTTIIKTTSDVDLWIYSNHVISNHYGSTKQNIFPIVVLSGVVDGDIKNNNCDTECFTEFLNNNGDTKQRAIADKMGIKLPVIASSPDTLVTHVRNYPNNVHKMYSLSEVFRNYKLSTYGKMVEIKLKNVIGPPLGTSCYIQCNITQDKIFTSNLDEEYSGKYILVSKQIKFNANQIDASMSQTTLSVMEVDVVLTFISDDVNNETIDEMKSILQKVVSEPVK